MCKINEKFIGCYFQEHPEKIILSSQARLAERGSAITEFLVTLPILLLLGLGTWQMTLIYNAKTTLNYATFEAARIGAVENAQSGPMLTELGLRLAPLYGGDGSPEKAFAAMARSSIDVKVPLITKIDIINPTQEAFDDFGTDIVDPKTGDVTFGIPNGKLRYRDRVVKVASGVNIQDANLLKIKVTYGYDLKVPLMSHVIPAIMTKIDPSNSLIYALGRLPITAVATVRMQSNAQRDPNNVNVEGVSNGNGTSNPQPPAEDTLAEETPNDQGQGGTPDPSEDTPEEPPEEPPESELPDIGGDDENNGGGESCSLPQH